MIQSMKYNTQMDVVIYVRPIKRCGVGGVGKQLQGVGERPEE